MILRNGTVKNCKMHSVLESQILTKSALQFTRNMTRFTRSLSDQMNSMIKTNHLSKIHFAEMQIIITRIEFTKNIWILICSENKRSQIWPVLETLSSFLTVHFRSNWTREKVYTKNFDSGMNKAGNRILRSLGYQERRSFFWDEPNTYHM